MKLRPEQLTTQLQKTLLPVYLVSGDEPLLVQETCDNIRAACKQAGFNNREVYEADKKFDWQLLLDANNSLSLFGDRKLIELRLPGKPGTQGSKALVEFAGNTSPDNVLLITTGKLDKASQQTKWVKTLENLGALIQVWPVDAQHLPRWINQRMKSVGINASRDAIQLLADRVEGNLLAASQEIEKLRLRGSDATVDTETIAAIVSDNARYDIFQLTDMALAGDASASLKMLNSLKAEGTEPTVLLWSLSRELRSLSKIASKMTQGTSINSALKQERVWDRRQPLIRNALSRLNGKRLNRLIERAGLIDHGIKGLRKANVWDELRELILQLAGKPWLLYSKTS
jgi:DNA polymerase-3 subunit delta